MIGEATNKLEVTSLADPDVERWRFECFGTGARWEPTLFEVDGSCVRAWTGLPLGARLLARLGPASTLRVLHSLGALAQELGGAADNGSRRRPLGARLSRVGTGATIAMGLLLAGSMASVGDPGSRTAAQAWADQNQGKLPTEYDRIVQFPVEYRRAIYTRLPRDTRRALWTAHVTRSAGTAGMMTGEQEQVVRRFFDDVLGSLPASDQPRHQVQDFAAEAIAAFGERRAYALFANLGPVEAQVGYPCNCSSQDDWCQSGKRCVDADDCRTVMGCGTAWEMTCAGVCGARQ